MVNIFSIKKKHKFYIYASLFFSCFLFILWLGLFHMKKNHFKISDVYISVKRALEKLHLHPQWVPDIHNSPHQRGAVSREPWIIIVMRFHILLPILKLLLIFFLFKWKHWQAGDNLVLFVCLSVRQTFSPGLRQHHMQILRLWLQMFFLIKNIIRFTLHSQGTFIIIPLSNQHEYLFACKYSPFWDTV